MTMTQTTVPTPAGSTLITQNATPAAILAEWARVGQVRVVDGERVPGTPLTLRRSPTRTRISGPGMPPS